jgi:hypothetical protein
MSSRLENEVARDTFLTVDDREVEVTLVPMNVGAVEPEAIRFHLKGLTAKNDKVVPLPVLLRALGWKVKLGEAIRPTGPKTKAAANAELEQLIQDLERQFGKREVA